MSRPGFLSLVTIKNGKVYFKDRRLFDAKAARLKDGDYDLTLEKHVAHRSNKQNAYFHAVVVRTLAEYWGLDPDMRQDFDEAKALIALHCNAKTVEVVNKQTGEVKEITIGASTSTLDREEFGRFLERCQRWAAVEFGVVIPDPDPEWSFKPNGRAA